MECSLLQLVPDEKIDTLWKACEKGSYDNIQKLLENLLLEGYPGSQVRVFPEYVIRYTKLIN